MHRDTICEYCNRDTKNDPQYDLGYDMNEDYISYYHLACQEQSDFEYEMKYHTKELESDRETIEEFGWSKEEIDTHIRNQDQKQYADWGKKYPRSSIGQVDLENT